MNEDNTTTTDGYVYVLFNIMFNYHGETVFKFGKTKNITQRLQGYTTSFLYPPEIKILSPKCINYNLAKKCDFWQTRPI